MTMPAREVRSFKVTIPAGTTEADPYTEDVTMPPRLVTAVHWRVPPGPSGLMGWRLTMSGGVAVIPTGGGWIITDDDAETWNLTGQPDGGYWQVSGYNTGAHDHSVYVDFLLDLVTSAAEVAAYYSNAQLSSTPGNAAAGVLAG